MLKSVFGGSKTLFILCQVFLDLPFLRIADRVGDRCHVLRDDIVLTAVSIPIESSMSSTVALSSKGSLSLL